MAQLRKAFVDKEKLGNLLIMLAKEWGVTTLQANLDDEDMHFGSYVVYFEADEDALRLLKIHVANTGLGRLRYVTP